MTNTATWYHCSMKVISRSTGRTAIAAAAYRSGERLHDNQLDQTYDYTRRRGIESTFIVAPDNAPAWSHNLEQLWNEAQAKDNRKNSCLAREIELALPNAIDADGRAEIAREFSRHLVERYGVAVSAALHRPSRYGDQNNYHAHILFTTRRMDEDGFGMKTRELDERKTGSLEVEHLREYASELINSYLERAGMDERVDHRSYEDRGIDQMPTEHLGVEASAMERRGGHSRIGDANREIAEHNRTIRELVDELAALDAEIAREQEALFTGETEPFPPLTAATPLPDAEISFPAALIQEPEIRNQEPEAVTEQQEPEAALSWEEQKAAAQDTFESEIVKAYESQIREHGEVSEYGLGRNWFDRTLVMFENLYYDTIEQVRGFWEKVIGGRGRDRDRSVRRDDPDSTPDREDDPDLGR